MNFPSASSLITDMYNLAKNLPIIHSAIPRNSIKSFHIKAAVAARDTVSQNASNFLVPFMVLYHNIGHLI